MKPISMASFSSMFTQSRNLPIWRTPFSGLVLSWGLFFISNSALAEQDTSTLPDITTAPTAETHTSLDAPKKARSAPILHYTDLRPNWAVEVTSSLSALGQKAFTVLQGDKPVYAFSFHFDYQPDFLQDYGVFGIGPSFALYPFFDSAISSGMFSNWSVGGQFRYQARFFRNQPVVPVFSYALERLTYRFNSGQNGSFLISGPSIGVWIFLNLLESSSASQMYIEHGIQRTYLVLELRDFSGSADNIPPVSGGSYYFGLRFEY